MNQKLYRKTPMGAYVTQKDNARRREIPWQFTFQTWWAMWEESGNWLERGQLPGQFRMVRVDVTGPYSPGNSVIQQRPQAVIRQQYKLLEEIPSMYAQGLGAWDYPHAALDAWVTIRKAQSA